MRQFIPRGRVGLVLLLFSGGSCSQKLTAAGSGDAGTNINLPFIPNLEGGWPETTDANQAACAEQRYEAQPTGLDIFFLVAASGSMLTIVEGGGQYDTKWLSLKNALGAFVSDPRSAGIGVGLHYFPSPTSLPPFECTDDAQCGRFGPCGLTLVCSGTGGDGVPLRTCRGDADCLTGSTCGPFGKCSTGGYCTKVGDGCIGRQLMAGTCEVFPASCVTPSSTSECLLTDYLSPTVPILDLPGGSAPFIQSLESNKKKLPGGRAPLGLAITGTLQYLRSSGVSSRKRRTVLALTTDGLATSFSGSSPPPSGTPNIECEPKDVGAIALALAREAGQTPGIPTYVIGVVSALETGRMWPDTLATGGGTGKALVVTPTSDLSAQLIRAFDEIRNAALPCEYEIPTRGRDMLDLSRVNLSLSPLAGPSMSVPYVRDPASCDPTQGGWHYDVVPGPGANPSRIVACASTCERFKTAGGGKVDILYGCKSRVIE